MQVFNFKQTKDNGRKQYITSLCMTLVVNMQQKGYPWGMVSVHVYPYVLCTHGNLNGRLKWLSTITRVAVLGRCVLFGDLQMTRIGCLS